MTAHISFTSIRRVTRFYDSNFQVLYNEVCATSAVKAVESSGSCIVTVIVRR